LIHIYFTAFLLLGAGIITWFLGFYVFDYTLTLLETRFPAYYAGAGPDFAAAFMQWIPLIVICVSALLYVLVQSQKPQEVLR